MPEVQQGPSEAGCREQSAQQAWEKARQCQDAELADVEPLAQPGQERPASTALASWAKKAPEQPGRALEEPEREQELLAQAPLARLLELPQAQAAQPGLE